jgi:hypothetical protein
LVVLPFENEEDAVTMANDNEYGLAASIWTQSIDRAMRLISKIDAGTVWVNSHDVVDSALPIGGFKASGFGKDMGPEQFEQYLRVKSVWIDFAANPSGYGGLSMTTDTKDGFTLKRRLEGGTPPCAHWGVDSETGILRDVLIGPIDHFTEILPTNAMNRKMLRDGVTLDVDAARDQYDAVLDIYRQADVNVHITPADADLPLQIWARDGSFMTPWGMIIGQMAQWWRRGEYGPVLDFCAANQIPIYDKVTAGCAEGGDFMMVTPDFAIMGCSGSAAKGSQQNKFNAGWLVRGSSCLFMNSIRISSTLIAQL